jgi:hypothetical protein
MFTSKNDEPLEPMRIDSVEVVQNATNDAVTAYRAKIQNARDEKKQLEARRKASALGFILPTDTANKSSSSASVGKNLPNNVLNHNLLQDAPPPSRKLFLDWIHCRFVWKIDMQPTTKALCSRMRDESSLESIYSKIHTVGPSAPN